MSAVTTTHTPRPTSQRADNCMRAGNMLPRNPTMDTPSLPNHTARRKFAATHGHHTARAVFFFVKSVAIRQQRRRRRPIAQPQRWPRRCRQSGEAIAHTARVAQVGTVQKRALRPCGGVAGVIDGRCCCVAASLHLAKSQVTRRSSSLHTEHVPSWLVLRHSTRLPTSPCLTTPTWCYKDTHTRTHSVLCRQHAFSSLY
jgi:hypothetical protein